MHTAERKSQDFDVFISYRHDTGFYMAQIIYSHLTAKGYTVFMDKTMKSGTYEEKIRKAIETCKNYVVILFPGDMEDCKAENSWLSREAAWAIECGVPNIIPIMCDNFQWPKTDDALSDSMKTVMKNNGLLIHKDYSLDKDLDNLCDNFLKNVNPSKPMITTADFFRYNLHERSGFTVRGVDMAFHGGSPWLTPGVQNDMFISSVKKGVPWRVLINTVDAAESIAQHMRDADALYIPFAQVRAQWKRISELYPDVLEVRECSIPLIHVHHCVRFTDDRNNSPYGELHIKYYAYNNTRLDNAFEHQVSSFSKYYSIYNEEFEFLWDRSTKL